MQSHEVVAPIGRQTRLAAGVNAVLSHAAARTGLVDSRLLVTRQPRPGLPARSNVLRPSPAIPELDISRSRYTLHVQRSKTGSRVE